VHGRLMVSSPADSSSSVTFAMGDQAAPSEMVRCASSPSFSLRRQATMGSMAVLERRRARGVQAGEKLRRPAKASKKLNIQYIALAEDTHSVGAEKFPTWSEIGNMNEKRKTLLSLARNTTPIDTVTRLGLVGRTVLPRLAKHPLFWCVVATFGGSATASRLGYHGDVEEVAGMLEGGGTFVAFMIIFYVGYCYERYNAQFADVQRIMNCITNSCMAARVTFVDSEETLRMWRYLNMLHVSAYCGLTTSLTLENFFLPVCERHHLLGEGEMRAEELASIHKIELDEKGSRACSMFAVWCFEVIKGETTRSSEISPPVHARMQAVVEELTDHIKNLFAYRFQVLPFIYTHLVSMSSTIYLLFTAFTKGQYFDEEADYGYGIVLPCLGVLMITLATYGLLEVGNTILDPFGDDPEDFALLHFVEFTIAASYEAIQIEKCGKRLKERTDFYDPEEIAAARRIVSKVIRRNRFLSSIQELLDNNRLLASQGPSCTKGLRASTTSPSESVASKSSMPSPNIAARVSPADSVATTIASTSPTQGNESFSYQNEGAYVPAHQQVLARGNSIKFVEETSGDDSLLIPTIRNASTGAGGQAISANDSSPPVPNAFAQRRKPRARRPRTEGANRSEGDGAGSEHPGRATSKSPPADGSPGKESRESTLTRGGRSRQYIGEPGSLHPQRGSQTDVATDSMSC